MKILYLSFFNFFLNSLSAQNLDEGKLRDIEKNILTYQIRNSHSTSYNDLIPDEGYKLLLKIESIPNTFNLNNKWKFYYIENDNFKFSNGKSLIIKTFTHVIPEYYKLSRKSLIATNEKNELIYLGGNFFKNSISDQFILSLKNIESYYPFIRIKLYQYNFEKIKFLRKNRNVILFEAFSNALWRKITIKVNRINPDEIIIEND